MLRISRARIVLFLTAAFLFVCTSTAQAQRVLEGPRTTPNKIITYRIGDERIRFTVRTVEGVDFDAAILARSAKTIALDAIEKNSPTHVWDSKWYFYAVPDMTVRKKYLMVVAHNITKDEIGWVAIANEGSRWSVLNNEGVTLTPWNGETAKFIYYFNGHRIDIEVYNPHDGGWSPHNIFYRISEPIDPQIRLRDEESTRY